MKRLIALCALTLGTLALAAEPTADEILKKYDTIMGPRAFSAVTTMVAHREDGTTRSYKMRMLKLDQDKFRVWFDEPSAVKGQEILRQGDNMWLYLPNLKRATRIASRENFQGGDFNNADVLRVNYTADYDGKVVPTDVPDTYCVELKAKNPQTAYDVVKLWVRKSDLMPVKGQYFGTSGQMIRSAEFSDYKDYGHGYTRPAHVVMKNEIVKARFSEMNGESFDVTANPPPQRFVQSDLGK
jgi:outer membrane lipoprotein-sorting protein